MTSNLIHMALDSIIEGEEINVVVDRVLLVEGNKERRTTLLEFDYPVKYVIGVRLIKIREDAIKALHNQPSAGSAVEMLLSRMQHAEPSVKVIEVELDDNEIVLGVTIKDHKAAVNIFKMLKTTLKPLKSAKGPGSIIQITALRASHPMIGRGSEVVDDIKL